MAIPLRALAEEPSLGVVVHCDRQADQTLITWVAATGLMDPAPWVVGGELVMVNGFMQKDETEQVDLVERLADAGAAAVGFSATSSQRPLPAVLDAAERLAMPVVVSPDHIPFIALVRFVAERQLGQEHQQRQRLLAAHNELTAALLSRQGLAGLVDVLARITGGPTAVVDIYGRTLASSPRDHEWPAGRDGSAIGESGRPVDDAVRLRTIDVEGYPAATLRLEAEGMSEVVGYAENLVGLELAKQHAVLTERRQLISQVVDDILKGVITDRDAEHQMEQFGIDLAGSHAMILASAHCDAHRLRGLLWPLSRLKVQYEGPRPVVGELGGRLFLLVAGQREINTLAAQVFDLMSSLVSGVAVGSGGAYAGTDGLRWSHAEAQSAISRGHGVHLRGRLDLPKMLLSNPQMPVYQMASEILEPLLRDVHDGGGELLSTLRAYFLHDESTAAVADALFVHRNTVRYRLKRIEHVTGRSLASVQDRMQLWLALLAYDAAPASGPMVRT